MTKTRTHLKNRFRAPLEVQHTAGGYSCQSRRHSTRNVLLTDEEHTVNVLLRGRGPEALSGCLFTKRYAMHMQKPLKKFGQYFLKSKSVVSAILDAAHVSRGDTVIEIGPGYGALTFELAKRAKKVYAVEKDRNLALFLRARIAERSIKNLEIRETDIRDLSISDIVPHQTPYTLVGNIPYYMTGFLFRKFLEGEKQKPETIVFMVQKEVAERIVSHEPGNSLLSVSVQAYGTPKIIMPVPRSCFSPSPNVDSAVLAVSDISRNRFKKIGISEKHFFTMVHAGFSHPRKLLVSNLAGAVNISKEKIFETFEKIGIKKEARASELSVEQWFEIAQILEPHLKNNSKPRL